jgi:hypothetical protein
MWLLELLAGMFLGYYVLKGGFRSWVHDVIKAIVVKDTAPEKATRRVAPKLSVSLPEVPKSFERTGIITSEEEIEKWFSQNPDLRKANEAAK